MDAGSAQPELSIIIPVFNEAGNIQNLIQTLTAQRDIDFELILCDGGSSDGTPDRFREMARRLSLPARTVVAPRGRGRQMNAGAAAARGTFYLFLHADSDFVDGKALRTGLDALAAVMQSAGHDRVAGRFALRFRQQTDTHRLFYYYHECKARLNRAGCTHGDQGFLLHRHFFCLSGPFDESIPVLEDTRLAETIRESGMWILLPGEIHTSPRRFETEGCARREILNTLVMAISASGRDDFLREMPRIYSSQDHTRGLSLYPFFLRIREMLDALPFRERVSFWYACGSCAVANIWQIAFFIDALRHFRLGLPPGEGENSLLRHFSRYGAALVDHPAGRTVAAVMAWACLRLICTLGRFREGPGRGGLPPADFHKGVDDV